MDPIRPSPKGWKTAATALILLIITLQAHGLRSGWPQDSAPVNADDTPTRHAMFENGIIFVKIHV